MISLTSNLILWGGGTLLFLNLVFFSLRKRSLGFLRGPESPSFILGHEHVLMNQTESAILEKQWTKEYGNAYKIASALGEQTLVVADPRGLQHILHTGGYNYPRGQDDRISLRRAIGRGLLWANGETHQHQRRTLNPAFSATQLRQFLALFQKHVGRLVQIWKDDLSTSEGSKSKVYDLWMWMPRITLDIIGESAFDYNFGRLEIQQNKHNELADALNNLFIDSRRPGKLRMLWQALRRNMPESLIDIIVAMDFTAEDKRFSHFLKCAKATAMEMLKIKGDATAEEIEDSKDILSILVRSNKQEDLKKRMDNDQVLSQMSTMILGGYDTSATTMTWILYELARHPEDQEKIYEEIKELRSLNPEGNFNSNQYDSLIWLNAAIKEGLRMHPVAPSLSRTAAKDDVIPLSEGVVSSSGETLTEIPVRKGQRIVISIAPYNCLPSVWGDDAEKWRLSRFVEKSEKKTSLGMYSNVMTFSAGIRGCIGWRFAVMQMQAVLTSLLESFEFSIPDEGLDIISANGGVAGPLIRSEAHKGVQMPLSVKIRRN